MTAILDKKRKNRGVFQRSFTRVANEVDALFRAENPDPAQVTVSFQTLEEMWIPKFMKLF